MTRQDQVLALLAEANPIADKSVFAIDTATRARLENIDLWSAAVPTTKRRSVEPLPPERSPRGWLVAAATAALVLAAGIAFALVPVIGDDVLPVTVVTPTSTSQAPTTTATPSTTVAPTTTADPAVEAEALAAVQAFATSDDIDAVMALFAADAEVEEYGRFFRSLEEIREWREARLRNWFVEVEDFRVSGNTVTFRQYTYWPDDAAPALAGSLRDSDTVTVIVEDGLITRHTAR